MLLLKPYRESATNTTAPPLGLLYLVASLREAFGTVCDIRYIDLSLQMQPATDMAPILTDWQPDVVGVSALNCEAAEAKAIATLTKV